MRNWDFVAKLNLTLFNEAESAYLIRKVFMAINRSMLFALLVLRSLATTSMTDLDNNFANVTTGGHKTKCHLHVLA